MPIYEYRCESCAERFEVLTRFAERDTAQICPVCESTKTRVLVSSFAVAGGEPSASDFASEGGGGGCCGGGCGSRGSRPNLRAYCFFPAPTRVKLPGTTRVGAWAPPGLAPTLALPH